MTHVAVHFRASDACEVAPACYIFVLVSWCPRIRPGSDLHVPSLELAFKELEHMLLIYHFDKGVPRETTVWWRNARTRRAVLRKVQTFLNIFELFAHRERVYEQKRTCMEFFGA